MSRGSTRFRACRTAATAWPCRGADLRAQSLLIDVQSDAPISRTITMALGAAADRVEVVATTPLAGVDLSEARDCRAGSDGNRRATSRPAARSTSPIF